jgi:hypothetical protein
LWNGAAESYGKKGEKKKEKEKRRKDRKLKSRVKNKTKQKKTKGSNKSKKRKEPMLRYVYKQRGQVDADFPLSRACDAISRLFFFFLSGQAP